MTKRIIALILCLVMSVAVFAGCSGGKIDPQSEDKGQQITMYLTENIYNLDPAYAYNNESSRAVVGLLFDTLFTLDNNGKVVGSLAKNYKTEKKVTDEGTEYYMYIEINDRACWSDNIPVTADDVVYAWKRILNPNNSFDAAALLFDIKNARAYNHGEVGKDDIGLYADDKLVTIQFEHEIDYEQFVLNLTSLALAPLREEITSKNADWAKKSTIMVCSGPFKLSRVGYYLNDEVVYEDINYSIKLTDDDNKVLKDKDGNDMYGNATEPALFKQQRINSFMLERNMYYYRNADKDENLDISVSPYRIIVDCSLSDEDIKEAYNKGILLYVGDIPMSLRSTYKDSATTKPSLSTNSVYLNQNAEIKKGESESYKLFSIKEVRQALSMVIDRQAIADALVFAKAATGLVPTGVFDTNSIKTLFRDASTDNFKYLTKDADAASKLLQNANITPSDYSFSISVSANDEVHLYIAKEIAKAWGSEGLGFNVDIVTYGTIANNDYHKDVKGVPSDLCDSIFDDKFLNGDYEVAIADLVALSADPFSVLAPFAKDFSGQAVDMSNASSYQISGHPTGYDSEEYNALIEKIYNEKTTANRSQDLHKAESTLMEDMPVIPVVFNETAYLVNEDILNLNNKVLFWDTNTDYYKTVPFAKMSLSDKDYETYTYNLAKFISEKFDTWKTNPTSYFGSASFCDLTFGEFIQESSNYLFLFRNKTHDDYEFIPEKKTDTEAATEAPTETAQ